MQLKGTAKAIGVVKFASININTVKARPDRIIVSQKKGKNGIFHVISSQTSGKTLARKQGKENNIYQRHPQALARGQKVGKCPQKVKSL